MAGTLASCGLHRPPCGDRWSWQEDPALQRELGSDPEPHSAPHHPIHSQAKTLVTEGDIHLF